MKFCCFWLCPIIALGSIIAFSNCSESLSQASFVETNFNLTQKSNYLKLSLFTFDVILSDNRDVSPFTLMEEESLGQLKIGRVATEVLQLLGSPTKKSNSSFWAADALHHQDWYYSKKGITLNMVSEMADKQQEVASIKLISPSKLRTKRGIGIGSSFDEVVRAYGKEQDQENSIPFKYFVAGSIYGGLIFSFENDRVAEIFLGAAAE